MYIGCHKTKNPNDDYLGSGKLLKRAIKKYRIENFKKEILFIFDTPTEMFNKEKEIVDRLFLESENTYNILIGGCGGFDYVNSNKKNLYGKNGDENHGRKNLYSGIKMKKFLIESGLWEQYKQKLSDSLKKKYSSEKFHWIGRKHKEETKIKIGKKLSIAQTGNNNSQYGTCWIYSEKDKENKRIKNKKEILQSFLDIGWKKGRKFNWDVVQQ